MTAGRRRPAWLPLLAAALGILLFSTLGAWQLQRVEVRQEQLAAIERGGRASAIELPYAVKALAGAEYRRVQARGRFLSDRQFLLDNRTLDGRIGYDVITPLALDDGRTVLVDRGWVPAGPRREPREPVALDAPAPVTVVGRLWRPEPGFALGPAVTAPSSGFPQTVARIDYEALAGELGRPLVPAVIRIEGGYPWALTPRPLEPPFGPERHYGYAFQWFALALTVLIVTLALQRRRWRRSKDATQA